MKSLKRLGRGLSLTLGILFVVGCAAPDNGINAPAPTGGNSTNRQALTNEYAAKERAAGRGTSASSYQGFSGQSSDSDSEYESQSSGYNFKSGPSWNEMLITAGLGLLTGVPQMLGKGFGTMTKGILDVVKIGGKDKEKQEAGDDSPSTAAVVETQSASEVSEENSEDWVETILRQAPAVRSPSDLKQILASNKEVPGATLEDKVNVALDVKMDAEEDGDTNLPSAGVSLEIMGPPAPHPDELCRSENGIMANVLDTTFEDIQNSLKGDH
jgi:hypothetical protein